MLRAEPIRPKLRNDIEEPTPQRSRMDNPDPNCEIPYTDSAEPNRTNPRQDNEDPRLKKSNTDKVEPNRDIP
jgi:hypothetical protein